MVEAIWVTIWLACGGAGAYIGWYRGRSLNATAAGLLLGLVAGVPVVAIAQFSLVGVLVAAVFVAVWMTLFALVHRHRTRNAAD